MMTKLIELFLKVYLNAEITVLTPFEDSPYLIRFKRDGYVLRISRNLKEIYSDPIEYVFHFGKTDIKEMIEKIKKEEAKYNEHIINTKTALMFKPEYMKSYVLEHIEEVELD